MKRTKVLALAFLVAAGMFTACGSSSSAPQGSGGASSQAGSTSSSPDSQTKTLNMWYHISPNQATVLQKFLAKFTDETGIAVETQSVPFSEMKKQLSVGVAAGKLPDVALCDTVDNLSFAAMGAAVDITAEVEAWGEIDNFYDGPRSSAVYEDRYYGLPFYSNDLAIMYNKTIFDEMEIAYPTSGWTWDDFKVLVEKTTTPEHYGLSMCLFKSEEGTFNVIPFLWQAGADYNTLDQAPALETLSMITDFYQKGYMSSELISMTQADMCSALFASGKSAMMVAGSWLNTNIKNENPDLQYGAVEFPKNATNASVLGGGNIMMLSDANRESAWELMKFLNTKDNQRTYCEEASYLPPRRDSAESSDRWSSDPVLSVYQKQMEVARARGPHPQWPQISSAIQFAVQDSLAGVKTPEQALKDAAKEIANIK